MTAYSMTVTNSVNMFGIAPPNMWNDYQWGAFLWGEGTADLITRTTKVLANSVAGASAVYKTPMHVISNSLTPSADMGAEYVRQGSYYHVFPDRTTDAESRDTPTWTAASSTAPTWTSAAAGSTTWS